jgi:hypothetical protein
MAAVVPPSRAKKPGFVLFTLHASLFSLSDGFLFLHFAFLIFNSRSYPGADNGSGENRGCLAGMF